MGLDAVVYRKPANVAGLSVATPGEVDPSTGEVSLRHPSVVGLGPDAFVAQHRRLGNVAEIGALREACTNILERADSIVLRQVLYSGAN
jgi:hypothetical protein